MASFAASTRASASRRPCSAACIHAASAALIASRRAASHRAVPESATARISVVSMVAFYGQTATQPAESWAKVCPEVKLKKLQAVVLLAPERALKRVQTEAASLACFSAAH